MHVRNRYRYVDSRQDNEKRIQVQGRGFDTTSCMETDCFDKRVVSGAFVSPCHGPAGGGSI